MLGKPEKNFNTLVPLEIYVESIWITTTLLIELYSYTSTTSYIELYYQMLPTVFLLLL